MRIYIILTVHLYDMYTKCNIYFRNDMKTLHVQFVFREKEIKCQKTFVFKDRA